MNDYIKELQSIIKGQVLTDEASLEHYSTDGSIFAMKPWAVVLPSAKEDIVNLVKWTAEQKTKIQNQKSKIYEKFSITCRGKGTDQAGGPINDGIILRFPGYLDKILEVGDDFIRVEPGALWGKVNEELAKKEHFVPCYPASQYFATIGGGIADNCAGEKSVKYGEARDYILSLKMIIADGSEIEIKPLNSKELIKKQSQNNLEGEIYRKLPDLLIANYNLIQNSKPDVNKDATGYWLYDVLRDETVDLSRLVCGSQGTLGIITEITLKTVPKPKLNGLLMASFDSLETAGKAIMKVIDLEPSAFEMVDSFLLQMIQKTEPKIVEELLVDPVRNRSPQGGRSRAFGGAASNGVNSKFPAIILLIEFDGDDLSLIKQKIGEVKNRLADLAIEFNEAFEKEKQNKLWAVRRRAATIAESAQGKKKALPFIEDSVVHPKRFSEYISELYKILQKYEVEFAVWGHAGNGNIHLQPFLDIGDKNDREKLFKIAEEVYRLVIKLKGALSGEHNDGLMRSPFLKMQFKEGLYDLFKQVKNIFDPLNIFNPHKKIDVDLEFAKKYLRDEYIIHFL